MSYEIRPLEYKELVGISSGLLKEHHDVLYAGYVKKSNELESLLEIRCREAGNAIYSGYRELKVESSFAQNATILHELYFENISKSGARPSEEMILRLKESFGSFQNFELELMEAGMSARGWVVLGLDNDGRMRLHLCDMHNMNGIWGSVPVLALDVYEHAYFGDYGANKKAYLQAFMKLINWKVVEGRLFELAIPT